MSKHFSYKLYIISFILIYSDTAIDDNFLQLLWKTFMLKGQRNELLSPEKNLTLILVISISVLSLQV